jgi:hypothetical protein
MLLLKYLPAFCPRDGGVWSNIGCEHWAEILQTERVGLLQDGLLGLAAENRTELRTLEKNKNYWIQLDFLPNPVSCTKNHVEYYRKSPINNSKFRELISVWFTL